MRVTRYENSLVPVVKDESPNEEELRKSFDFLLSKNIADGLLRTGSISKEQHALLMKKNIASFPCKASRISGLTY